MDDFVPCLVPPSLPIEVEEDSGLSLSSVLLDKTAYISAAPVSNATTAVGVMSTDKPIHVSFCLARPPRLSYMCVHFPGPAADLSFTVPPGTPAVHCTKEAPQIISTHADLALLRVAVPGARDLRNPRYYDYFVYTAGGGTSSSSLDRLPHPHPQGATFGNNEVAIFRCPGSGTSRYVIAGLRNTLNSREFKLQRYDTDTCCWTSTLLSVHAPVRDEVLPIPPTASELMFHDTTKVITLGGPRATICWVDLWRGMLLCNVLDLKPILHDVPLPKPSRANRRFFCIGCPHAIREITVVTLPGEEQHSEIKYVEMETRPGIDMPPPSRQLVDSDGEDDDAEECDLEDVAPYWKATIWTMPVPVTSYKDWRKDKDCRVDVTDITVDNSRHSELLLLPRLRIDPDNVTMRFRRLLTAHPTLGLGRDGGLIIYLLSKVDLMDKKGWVIAVGARDKKLQGIAELDSRKNNYFRRYYRHTDFSQFLIKATGEVGPLVERNNA